MCAAVAKKKRWCVGRCTQFNSVAECLLSMQVASRRSTVVVRAAAGNWFPGSEVPAHLSSSTLPGVYCVVFVVAKEMMYARKGTTSYKYCLAQETLDSTHSSSERSPKL